MRRALRLRGEQVSATLTELLELPCEVLVRRIAQGAVGAGHSVWLSCGALQLGVVAEPGLAAFLAARVLRRSEPLAHPGEPLSPTLLGLLGALALETLRRQGVSAKLRDALSTGVAVLEVEVTLLLEGRPFSLTLYAAGLAHETREASLRELGEIALTLPLAVATVSLSREELATLEPGGALLLGDACSIEANGLGAGVLVAPGSERGIGVTLKSGGALVVGEATEARLSVESDQEPRSDSPTLSDAVLDAPVVVRVELGAVSMSAREWAQLGPGDVIETAQRVAEPVVLRVAGREVGRGELVNVDGQVGVRIQKLFEGA